jgi:eukaryotic-like serine/threonine-protein kinase
MAEKRSIGKFHILGTLGKGAHSAILHVRCERDSKQYALKVVPIESKADQKYYDQAELEFRVGQMLDHPNLVKVYAFETVRDWLFRVKKVHLLSEYVNGKTLDNMPGLSIPRLVQIFARMAAGLAHMHRRGVFHADLKPNNVILSRAGEVKIFDYGLAWIKGEPKHRVQGTPEYMAPEQSRQTVANERTDIYNLGATMYRLITWRHPPSTVPAPGSPVLTAKVFHNLLKPVKEYTPQAPPVLANLIERCLMFDPTKRPERVSDVHDTLKQLEEKVVQAPEDGLEAMGW